MHMAIWPRLDLLFHMFLAMTFIHHPIIYFACKWQKLRVVEPLLHLLCSWAAGRTIAPLPKPFVSQRAGAGVTKLEEDTFLTYILLCLAIFERTWLNHSIVAERTSFSWICLVGDGVVLLSILS